MIHDQQTFGRAANTALIGLTVQAVLALVTGLIGLYAQSAALIAATWHLLGGLPLWGVLWVLYNQHRLERLEALEAEQLTQDDAQAAALFAEAGEQLALARKRLDRLYKMGLKVTGLLVALYLLAVGGLLLYFNIKSLQAEDFEALGLREDANLALLGMVVLGGALVGFLTARYIAGMTQLDAWSALRAGASYLMGNVLVLALGGLALGWKLFGDDRGFVYLSLIAPAVMALLGLEIVLSAVLSMYRPVRKGEFQRPIFDSRLLGFLTQPQSFGKIITDTINYQFGFEISRSWFYRLMAQATLPLIILCILLVIGMSSVVIVGPQQQAIITVFGDRAGEPVGPGMHIKPPWPIGRTDKHNVQQVRQLFVGSRPGATAAISGRAVLWTNPHTEAGIDEDFMLTAPHVWEDQEDDGVIIGELIGGDIVVKYRIKDLVMYTSRSTNPDLDLALITERAATAAFRTKSVDQLLGADRRELSATLYREIKQQADQWELGIEVMGITVMALHPPQAGEVAASFNKEIGALQEQQSTIEKAKKDAVTILAGVAGSPEKAESLIAAITALNEERDPDARAPKQAEIDQQIRDAGGSAAQRLLEARARRWQRLLTEQALAERFLAEQLAFEQAPSYFRHRMYLETLANALNERRKIIVHNVDAPPHIRIELKETGTTLEGIFEQGE